jgi:hypothetical protein
LVTCAARKTQPPNRATRTAFSIMPVSGVATPITNATANNASMRINNALARRMSATTLPGYAVRWRTGRWALKTWRVAISYALAPTNVEFHFNV